MAMIQTQLNKLPDAIKVNVTNNLWTLARVVYRESSDKQHAKHSRERKVLQTCSNHTTHHKEKIPM